MFAKLRTITSAVAGAADEGIFWFKWGRHFIGDKITDENSAAYKWSGRTVIAATFFIPGDIEVEGAEAALRFAPGKWLSHFQLHGAEFAYKTSVEYLQGARSLIGRTGVQSFLRANGDRLFYDVAKNQFAVVTKKGIIRTFFRPRDSLKYWLGQTGR